MNSQLLYEKLNQLQHELSHIASTHKDEQQVLIQLILEVQSQLEDSANYTTQSYEQLNTQLKNSIAKFETSHPTLTLVMGQIVDMLARVGI